MLDEAIAQAGYIFVGKLVAVGGAPGCWSGQYECIQKLTYAIERVLKSSFDDRREANVTVAFTMLAPGTLAGRKPGLRPELTRLGERYLVVARAGRDGVLRLASIKQPPVLATAARIARVEAQPQAP
jgi:hypothetical protein